MRLQYLTTLLLTLTAFSASAAQQAADRPARDVVIGQEYRLQSSILGEERTIFVSKPGNYEQTDERYPVLFILDGRNPFYYVSASARFLAANQRIPDLLVVAIANPSATRARDLTPSATAADSLRAEPGGGSAEKFRRFLADELIPWVDSQLRTRPMRVLAGHSYGGLFAVDALLEEPGLFDAYIAISPSLWWDDQRHARELPQHLTGNQLKDRQLYITASGDESPALRGGVMRFASVLEQSRPTVLRWRVVDMPAESHTSGPLRGIQDGLEFIFSDFRLADPLATFLGGGAQAVENFFARRQERYGQASNASRLAFQSLARPLADAGRYDELVSLAGRYPEFDPPPTFHLQVAEGYRGQGRLQDARRHFELALKGDPTLESARSALEQLRETP